MRVLVTRLAYGNTDDTVDISSLLWLLSPASPRDGPPYYNRDTSASDLGRQIARILKIKGTRLILHLDVNKTLIMVDPSGGKTQSQVLNSILAEICWGHVELAGGKTSWKWDGGPPSLDTPSLPRPTEAPWDRADEELDSPPSLTYSDFLHETFAAETDGGSNLRMKEARDYRKCILALKEANADFAFIFRTFGGDIAGVAAENNTFCEGRHPLFPGVKMDGTDGQADYRVHLEGVLNVGAFFRDEEGVALVMDTLDNPRSTEHLRRSKLEVAKAGKVLPVELSENPKV